jgi:hypothetical protein
MKLRLIALAACSCVLVTALVLLLPREAGALPQNESDSLYLDADGNEVGWVFRGCNGQRIVEGVTSAYRRTITTACNSGGYSTTCHVNLTPTACDMLPFRCILVGTHWVCD